MVDGDGVGHEGGYGFGVLAHENDRRGIAAIGPDHVDESVDAGHLSHDDARLHGLGRGAAEQRFGGPKFHGGQLGGSAGQRLGAEFHARGDDAGDQGGDGTADGSNQIYISIPEDNWDEFARDFSVQVYNNKADYKKNSLILSALLALLGGVATYFISGHALRPIREFSEKIEEVQAQNLADSRIEENKVKELNQLRISYNKMLERLADAFEIQRQFTANAAHELRTPLSVMQVQLDLYHSTPHPGNDADTLQTLKMVTEQNGRLSKMVKTLLDMSELQTVGRDETIAVDALVDEVLVDLEPLAQEKEIKLVARADHRAEAAQLETTAAAAARGFIDDGLVARAERLDAPRSRIEQNMQVRGVHIEIAYDLVAGQMGKARAHACFARAAFAAENDYFAHGSPPARAKARRPSRRDLKRRRQSGEISAARRPAA